MISNDLIIARGSSSGTSKRCLLIKEIAGTMSQELDDGKGMSITYATSIQMLKKWHTLAGSTGALGSRFIIFKVNDRLPIPITSSRFLTSLAI
jgi:hypothetical protein